MIQLQMQLIFSHQVKEALAPAIIDVYRNDTSTLSSIDFKASNPEIMSLPAGPVAMLMGKSIKRDLFR